MSRKYKRLDDWESELIGKTFTFLTVISVTQIINDKNKKRYAACCKCKCGKECQIDVYGLVKGHNKSCGCYETSEENSERHRRINEKNRNVMSENRKKWCKEHSDVMKEIGVKLVKYYKDNPEKVEEISNKCKKWAKDNPDKVKEIVEWNRQWRKSNPDRVAEAVGKQQQWRADKEKVEAAKDKRRQTLIDHPEICERLSINRAEWCKNNPGKLKEAVKKRKRYYKDHPDKIAELSSKVKQWVKENPEKFEEFQDAGAMKYLNTRLNTDYTRLLNVIHPDYKQQLLLGELKSDSVIKTKCPNCGYYDYHSLHNVFTVSKQDFRTGYAPLCSCCASSITTSKYEQELEEFIKSCYNGEVIRNSRDIISPLELDLYYPEKKIAIEFNGDYWHDENHKPKDYHLSKYLKCKENGILLVSIFETEWNNSKEEIKDYLKDTINSITNKLSYLKGGYVSNNYPDINNHSILSNILEDYYVSGNSRVYTCGYTKLGDSV